MENEVKEPAPKYQYISPDEYLAMERASELKYEYYNGHVEAMCGASLKHNQIAMNLYGNIFNYLKGKKCKILPNDMRVSSPGKKIYTYPDATIVCDTPELEDDAFDTLLNPSVLIEILSPSTRQNDLGYKLSYYQQIPSLKEYIIVDSVRRAVQIIRSQENGLWETECISPVLSHIYIRTIDLYISLDDIYYLTGL
ncbi:MAG TPA: Uma2 family endonuclease [Chitinophagaceae bacterium]|nr:Uma2 family endonuclease [Chitinophagaceae bacterium]